MNCLKCGRDTLAEQVFCQDCLIEMEKYPVKPGTVIQLPQHKDAPSPRRTKRRNLSAEEHIRQLQRRIRILAVLLFLSMLAILFLLIPSIEHLTEPHYLPGQNYSSISSAQTNMEADGN